MAEEGRQTARQKRRAFEARFGEKLLPAGWFFAPKLFQLTRCYCKVVPGVGVAAVSMDFSPRGDESSVETHFFALGLGTHTFGLSERGPVVTEVEEAEILARTPRPPQLEFRQKSYEEQLDWNEQAFFGEMFARVDAIRSVEDLYAAAIPTYARDWLHEVKWTKKYQLCAWAKHYDAALEALRGLRAARQAALLEYDRELTALDRVMTESREKLERSLKWGWVGYNHRERARTKARIDQLDEWIAQLEAGDTRALDAEVRANVEAASALLRERLGARFADGEERERP